MADLLVNCDPVGSDDVPQGFAFIAELTQGETSCNDCLVMLDSLTSYCDAYPKYCPCLQDAFVKNCKKFSEQLPEGCKSSAEAPESMVRGERK